MSKEFKPLPEQISGKMIAAIKDGKSIFEKPMNADGTSQFVQPFNASTGKKYTGPAALILMMQDKTDPRWMTSNQASFNKTHVLKGAKGTLINFFTNNVTRPVMENGEQVKKENGFPKTERVTLDKPQLVDAWLFNGSQLNEMPEWKNVPQELTPAERAQSILDASGAKIEDAGLLTDYDRQNDTLFLPPRENFVPQELYYATAIHELLHWTAHESRLNRPEDQPGSDTLIKEELRANIASVFISSELNLPYDVSDHIGYLNAFAQLMNEDPKELFRAASDAQKMADFVLGLEPKIELEQEVTAAKSNPNKLEKGDVINYNGSQYTVLEKLKNKVFEMQKDDEKFKLSSKNGLYNSLLEAKKNPQGLVKTVSENENRKQEEELETSIAEEETGGYKMKR
jgi:antirestriction protein ArdC